MVTFVALVVGFGLGTIPLKVTAHAALDALAALAAIDAIATIDAATEGPASVTVTRTPTSEEPVSLQRGIYFGWVGGSGSRFLLAGAPCAGDTAPQLAEIHGGDLWPSRVLAGSAVSSYRAPLDAGRELSVTALSSAALAGSLVDANDSPAAPSATTKRLSFSGLRARCRTWREIDSDLGSAGVLLLPATPALEPRPGLAAHAGRIDAPALYHPGDEALEAHVLPLPDHTALLALLLLWNRTPASVALDAIHYAPGKAASGRVLAVSGTFDNYDELASRMLALTSSSDTTATLRRSADDLDLVLEPGGIALIGIDRSSFANSRPRPSGSTQLVYLSFPVIDHHSLGAAARLNDRVGLQAPRHVGPGPAPVASPAAHLAMTTPLYARWSLARHR